MTNNQLTDEQIAQLLGDACMVIGDRFATVDELSAAKAIRALVVELQERRKADSEPVAWQYRVSAGPATGWSLWHDGKGEQYENSYKVERRPLYTHAQPVPVVQCPYPCGWDNLNKLAIQDAAFVVIALVEGEPATESIRQAVITNNDRLLKAFSACRAAMLAAAPREVKP